MNGNKISFSWKGALAIAGVLLALVMLLTCFYTVDDKQQAVVTTFGKITDTTGAGFLHNYKTRNPLNCFHNLLSRQRGNSQQPDNRC